MKKDLPFRIGIDARMYGAEQTGIGTYIQYLINSLIEIDKKNEYFLFFLPKTFSLIRKLPENFHKIKVDSHWYSFREQTVFLKDILRHRLDLMHFPHFNVPILYPRKFIVTIHDITPKFFPGHKMGRSWYRRKAYGLIMRWGTRKAQFIITPSLKTKIDLINFYKVDKDKIQIIYEGVKNKKTTEKRKEFLRNYDQKKKEALNKLKSKFNFKGVEKPYLFYVGVWREHKNLLNLIRAFNILVKQYSFKGQLILGGREDIYYPEVRQEWKELGLGDKIVRPGFLSSEKLTLFYQAADVFVLPSLYEGFGLVCLEALNQGTAVVCSKIDALKEVVGDAVLYFDPQKPDDMADKIWRALSSRKLQRKLLLNAQIILDKYDWDKMARETWKIYMRALKNH